MRIKWFSFIRIVGLVSVLSYHFFKNAYPGGFIGVDVFFTFSGFLITALMIDEFAKSDGFRLIAFYRRRFYRIVPPLIISVLVVIPFTYLVSRDYITGLGKQVAAAFGFVTNYFEILTGGSYETKFIPHLFVHTWSLAVEMHFYLLWGLIIFIVAGIIGHLKSNSAKKLLTFKIFVFILSLIFFIASALLMAVKSKGLTDFSPVYFSSLTHCFPFFIGAMVSTFSGIKSLSKPFKWVSNHLNAPLLTILLILSFVAIFVLGFKLDFDERATYTYGILLASIIASFSIMFARMLHDHTPNVNEPKWATFIADTSYSMYLYHWPLFVIFSQIMAVGPAVILTIGVGLPCSAISYYIIEPEIAGKHTKIVDRFRPYKSLKVLNFAVAIALAITTMYTIKIAPNLTNLENRLWVSGLTQSRDQMSTYKDLLVGSHDDHSSATNTPIDKIPAGVSIIGDSVTSGTRDYLGSHVAKSTIDAKGDRSMDLAYNVIMAAQKNHILRKNVVLCIGTNALDGTDKQLSKIVKNLEPGHHLIIMTPYDRRADPSWNSSKLAVFERTLPAKYNYIVIADWQKVAAKHPEVFDGTDGVHFAGRHEGDVIYAQTVNAGLKEANKKPVKK
ncbi:acyltransferase family protein [Fructilactobacillus sp. Tb1]|uniref:acyltransferase family protein n=1 Tax=Fructilactobacillus sp. Tb1 TaxID=3422304 RepID=UPI003D290D19